MLRNLFLAVIVIALGASTASAQRGARVDPARRSFEEGLEHAQREEWQEALDAFQRSFDMSARPVTMMNLAGALERLRRLVEAAEAYRSFLSMSRGGTTASLRDEAERQLRSLEERIPRVRLQLRGVLSTDIIRLDAFEVTASALRRPIPIDPGEHSVVVAREGGELAVAFTATEGSSIEVVVDATNIRTSAGTASSSSSSSSSSEGTVSRGSDPVDGGQDTIPPRPNRSIMNEPAFWVLIAAGGATLITGVVLAALSLDAYAFVDNAVPNTRWTSLAQDYENAYLYGVIGWPLVGVGAAALGAAGLWAALYGPSGPTEHYRLELGPTGANLRIRF